MKALATLAACCALAAGCGGGQSADRPVRIVLPSQIAREVAGQSRAIAAVLDEGRACEARHRFAELEAYVAGVTAAHAVPRPLRADLRAGVGRLGAVLPACVPPPPPPPTPRGRGDEPGKGKGHGHGKGGGNDNGGGNE